MPQTVKIAGRQCECEWLTPFDEGDYECSGCQGVANFVVRLKDGGDPWYACQECLEEIADGGTEDKAYARDTGSDRLGDQGW